PATDSALQRHSASHQQLDCPGAKRSLSLPIRSHIPALRSRPEIWPGSTGCPSLAANHLRANLDPESLAKRSGRALGGKLPPGPARSHHRGERATPEKTSFGLHSLLSPRSHAPGITEANPRWQTAFRGTGLHCFASTTRWPAPSL